MKNKKAGDIGTFISWTVATIGIIIILILYSGLTLFTDTVSGEGLKKFVESGGKEMRDYLNSYKSFYEFKVELIPLGLDSKMIKLNLKPNKNE